MIDPNETLDRAESNVQSFVCPSATACVVITDKATAAAMVLKLRVAYTFSKFFERPMGLCDGYTQNTAGSVYIRWIGKNIRRKAVADGLPVLYPRV